MQCGYIPQEQQHCKKKVVIWGVENSDQCFELCDEHEECHEFDYNEKKEKCILRSKVSFEIFCEMLLVNFCSFV